MVDKIIKFIDKLPEAKSYKPHFIDNFEVDYSPTASTKHILIDMIKSIGLSKKLLSVELSSDGIMNPSRIIEFQMLQTFSDDDFRGVVKDIIKDASENFDGENENELDFFLETKYRNKYITMDGMMKVRTHLINKFKIDTDEN